MIRDPVGYDSLKAATSGYVYVDWGGLEQWAAIVRAIEEKYGPLERRVAEMEYLKGMICAAKS